jgi:hypothetical protein
LKILFSCPVSSGGIAEHANYQARAMKKLFLGGGGGKNGSVTLLCTQDFLDGRVVGYRKEEVFSSRFSVFGLFAGRIGELLDRSLKIIFDQWRLAWEVFRRKPDAVLLASYSEYLSPLWVWPHWFMARVLGITYSANLHDPVRDYVVGPKWWHDLSVRMAYWPISVGVVHQRLPEPSPVPRHVHVVEAPVGVYDLQESPEDPEAIRAAWGVGRRVAPEDGRSQLGDREKEDDLTTKDTNTHERGEAGLCLDKPSGAAFSNPSTSELARDSENSSLTHFVSGPSFSPSTSYPLPATALEAQVFVLGVAPMARWWEGAKERNATIREINALLAEGAKGNGYQFIELESRLADENGFLRGDMTSDGVHLSAKGYEAVLGKMKNGPLRGR